MPEPLDFAWRARLRPWGLKRRTARLARLRRASLARCHIPAGAESLATCIRFLLRADHQIVAPPLGDLGALGSIGRLIVDAADAITDRVSECPFTRVGVPLSLFIQQRGFGRPEAVRRHLVLGIAQAPQGGFDRVVAGRPQERPSRRKHISTEPENIRISERRRIAARRAGLREAGFNAADLAAIDERGDYHPVLATFVGSCEHKALTRSSPLDCFAAKNPRQCYYYNSYAQTTVHLHDFVNTYNFARCLKTR